MFRFLPLIAALGSLAGGAALALPPGSPANVPSPAAGSEVHAALSSEPTFNRDIAPILYQHCASCHHPGQVAPFSLLTYGDAQKRAPLLASVTASRQMPPWKAESHGEFVDENRLTDEEIALIKHWADGGTKEGKRSDLPAPPKFTTDWRMGEPDMVIGPPQPYTLSAEGRDEYHNFILPTNFPEDRYLAAIEVRPGNRTVVHHVVVSLDTNGTARKRAAGKMDFVGDTGLGFTALSTLSIWAPGNFPRRLAAGTGLLLPKGADIVLQVHYHRTGKVEVDDTKLGLYFCKEPVDKKMQDFLMPAFLLIPAGEANYETHSEITVPTDETLRTIMPHMHLLGSAMTVTVTFPDGKERTLINVPHWDFDWQATYTYKEPVKIPKGSKIKLVAHYDNSKDNPRNPFDPPRLVGWGEQTTNEMCIAFLGFTADDEHLLKR